MWYTDLPTIFFTPPAPMTSVTCVRIVIHSLDQVLCLARTGTAAWFFDFFRTVFCGIWIQGSLEDIPAINFHPGSSESDEYSLRYCAHKNRGARYTEFEMTTVLMKSAVMSWHLLQCPATCCCLGTLTCWHLLRFPLLWQCSAFWLCFACLALPYNASHLGDTHHPGNPFDFPHPDTTQHPDVVVQYLTPWHLLVMLASLMMFLTYAWFSILAILWQPGTAIQSSSPWQYSASWQILQYSPT